MADQHYRVDSEYALTQAVIAILQYARSSKDEFSFGPSDWPTADQQGLTLSGTDLDGAKQVLSGITGVVEAKA